MDSYIISLEEPHALQAEIIKKGLRPHWVQAIRGSSLTSEQIHAATVWPYSYVAPVTATAIGMSHIKAWKAFLDTSAAYAVILEEDAVLAEDFTPCLEKAIESVPQDYDILYLGCYGCKSAHNLWTWMMSYMSMFRAFERINPFIVSPTIALALHGYVLSRKGAEQLVSIFDRSLFGHIDGCILLVSTFGQLKTYAVTKHIVTQTSTNQQLVASTNAVNQHPYVVSKLLSFVHFDPEVRLHYICNFTLFQLGQAIVTIMTGWIAFVGLIMACCRVPLTWLTAVFILISLPDLLTPTWSILLHYVVWVAPTLAMTLLKMII